jgi:hypothetical protein
VDGKITVATVPRQLKLDSLQPLVKV